MVSHVPALYCTNSIEIKAIIIEDLKPNPSKDASTDSGQSYILSKDKESNW